MTPEEYWKRIELAEDAGIREPRASADRIIRYLEWYEQQRRRRRRRIVRAVAAGSLVGIGAVLLIASAAMVRGVRTTPPVASTTPSRSTEPASIESANESPRRSLPAPPETRAVAVTPAERESSRERPEGEIHGLSGSPTPHEVARPEPSTDRPVRSEPMAAREGAPAAGLTASIVPDATPSSAPVSPASLTSVPSPFPARPRPAVEPRAAEVRPRWPEAAALLERFKQTIALTPAEARRLEKIKETLARLPESRVAKQAVEWMKSLPSVDVDRDAPYERRTDRPETP